MEAKLVRVKRRPGAALFDATVDLGWGRVVKAVVRVGDRPEVVSGSEPLTGPEMAAICRLIDPDGQDEAEMDDEGGDVFYRPFGPGYFDADEYMPDPLEERWEAMSDALAVDRELRAYELGG